MSLALFHAYRGAADLHAHLAGGALVGVDFDGWLGLNIFEKYAGTTGYNYRGFVRFKLFFYCFFCCGEVIRINDNDTVYSDCVSESLKADCRCRVTLYCKSGSRILLMSGHAGDAVVKDDNN